MSIINSLFHTGIFLKTPQNQTINEFGTAIFQCFLTNSSYKIYWLVNETDADLQMFHQRGVSIAPINATASQLSITGHGYNNETLVQCAGLLYQDHELKAFEISQKAFMFIKGSYKGIEDTSSLSFHMNFTCRIPYNTLSNYNCSAGVGTYTVSSTFYTASRCHILCINCTSAQ